MNWFYFKNCMLDLVKYKAVLPFWKSSRHSHELLPKKSLFYLCVWHWKWSKSRDSSTIYRKLEGPMLSWNPERTHLKIFATTTIQKEHTTWCAAVHFSLRFIIGKFSQWPWKRWLLSKKEPGATDAKIDILFQKGTTILHW